VRVSSLDHDDADHFPWDTREDCQVWQILDREEIAVARAAYDRRVAEAV
jgi:hypothetical protein